MQANTQRESSPTGKEAPTTLLRSEPQPQKVRKKFWFKPDSKNSSNHPIRHSMKRKRHSSTKKKVTYPSYENLVYPLPFLENRLPRCSAKTLATEKTEEINAGSPASHSSQHNPVHSKHSAFPHRSLCV